MRHRSSLDALALMRFISWQCLHLISIEPSTSSPLKNSLWQDRHRYSVVQCGISVLDHDSAQDPLGKGMMVEPYFSVIHNM